MPWRITETIRVRFRPGCGIRTSNIRALSRVGAGPVQRILAASGIRTLFDQESQRLKQVELSGPRGERVSLDIYADALPAREAEFRQEAKYCEWSEPGSNVLR
jgi:hypothetical protein